MKVLVLDSEAISVLMTSGGGARRLALIAQLEAARGTRRRVRAPGRVVVPTTVRVESGWDHSLPKASAINRMRVEDDALDAVRANVAATIRASERVSVADAHIGAFVLSLPEADSVVVATSDETDVGRVVGARRVKIFRV